MSTNLEELKSATKKIYLDYLAEQADLESELEKQYKYQLSDQVEDFLRNDTLFLEQIWPYLYFYRTPEGPFIFVIITGALPISFRVNAREYIVAPYKNEIFFRLDAAIGFSFGMAEQLPPGSITHHIPSGMEKL